MRHELAQALSLARLEEVLASIPNLRIAVLGDFFLDKYLITNPALSEISLETGLEARQVVQVRCSPGAAGTVTNNLSALGVGKISAIGVIGDDGEGYELRKGLQAKRVQTEGLIADTSRFTPTYAKPMVREATGERELERLDIKNRSPIGKSVEDAVIAALTSSLAENEFDAIIIADQVQERNSGVVTDGVRQAVAELAEKYPGILFFADSRVRIGEFKNVTVKPNCSEASAALGVEEPESDEEAGRTARMLSDRTRKPVFLTLGERGILACWADSQSLVAARDVNGPIDIVGAGDSATAGIVCALCAGASPIEAAVVGNLCASVTIRKLGTTGTASPDELRRAFQSVGV